MSPVSAIDATSYRANCVQPTYDGEGSWPGLPTRQSPVVWPVPPHLGGEGHSMHDQSVVTLAVATPRPEGGGVFPFV